MSFALVVSFLLACANPSIEDSQPGEIVEPLTAACGHQPVRALLALPAGEAWVGCGDGGVLRTLDAGESFEPMHASRQLQVNALALDGDGALLVCGRDLASRGVDALLLRFTERRGWESLLAGASRTDDACALLAVDSQGGLALSDTRGDALLLRAADAQAWQQPPGWWLGAPSQAPRVWDLQSGGGCWFGLGADLVSPPVFLRPASTQRCLPLRAVAVDPGLAGELWTLASPDDGEHWLAGGRELRDEAESAGVLYRSSPGGERWRPVPLPLGLGWVRDLDFSPSGACGVAVGSRTRPEEGGFVLVSQDGGRSWQEIDAQLPPLRVVSVLEQGFLVGGELGFVGRGRCW